ncbi:MAG: 50S ribosomal protein L25 [Acidimicrobiia bacterium]|nr:50S ribosomal protein L25 [Acidimicrobiia bacterium]
MATEVTLPARLRTSDEIGSRPSRRLRRTGYVPATVYGRGNDPRNVAVEYKSLFRAISTDAGLNALINLDIDGAGSELTMARVIERHPTRDEIRHVDFLVISKTEVVSTEVPITVVGDAVGVSNGGILDQVLYALPISALPTEVPQAIEVDVTALEIGETITVASLTIPEGVEVTVEDDVAVVNVLAQRVAEEEEEVEGEEGEEGEEGAEAAAEGEAAAEAGGDD